MITVKLFGTMYTDSRIKEMQVDAKTISDIYLPVFEEIKRKNPETEITLADLKDCLVAINGKRVKPKSPVKDGDEVWFFTAVGGG